VNTLATRSLWNIKILRTQDLTSGMVFFSFLHIVLSTQVLSFTSISFSQCLYQIKKSFFIVVCLFPRLLMCHSWKWSSSFKAVHIYNMYALCTQYTFSLFFSMQSSQPQASPHQPPSHQTPPGYMPNQVIKCFWHIQENNFAI